MSKWTPARVTFATAALVAGAAVCVLVANSASAAGSGPSAAPRLPAIPYSDGPGHGYPVNSHGQSYGSSADAPAHGGEPDLIAAIATNGMHGYVKRADLQSPQPKNPEEAVAMTKANAGKTKTVPVYDQEGQGVIGEFVMGGGSSTG